MTPAEAQVLLSMAAAYDNRKPDPDAAKAWAAALDDLRFEDCRVALIDHYRESRDWLMPVDVRSRVRRTRKARLENHPPVIPPAGLTDAQELAWMRQVRHRIGNGEQLDPNGGRALVDHSADLRQLMRGALDHETEETP